MSLIQAIQQFEEWPRQSIAVPLGDVITWHALWLEITFLFTTAFFEIYTLCFNNANNTKHNIYMVDIEIKKDGHKVVQPYAPVTELNIMETVHRKGFTTQQVAERLGVTKAAVSQMT